MGLRLKFNLVLLAVFGLGLLASCVNPPAWSLKPGARSLYSTI